MRTFTLGSFLRDRLPVLVLGAAGAFALALVARVLGVNAAGSAVLGGFFALMLVSLLAWDFARRVRFYGELEAMLGELEHAYYLTSLLDRPGFLDGQLLYDACQAVICADGADLAAEREAARKIRAQRPFL
ncbi:MAG: hypothetical protein Q4D06_03040 [Coriobacteriia bacterium]|nr:hypothetical protein [Coriobacteriia bacterium]